MTSMIRMIHIKIKPDEAVLKVSKKLFQKEIEEPIIKILLKFTF
jgi:hypothetical protein